MDAFPDIFFHGKLCKDMRIAIFFSESPHEVLEKWGSKYAPIGIKVANLGVPTWTTMMLIDFHHTERFMVDLSLPAFWWPNNHYLIGGQKKGSVEIILPGF